MADAGRGTIAWSVAAVAPELPAAAARAGKKWLTFDDPRAPARGPYRGHGRRPRGLVRIGRANLPAPA